jgi:hypothetical protein
MNLSLIYYVLYNLKLWTGPIPAAFFSAVYGRLSAATFWNVPSRG